MLCVPCYVKNPVDNKKIFNAFNVIGNFGFVRLQKLLNYFPNLETAWDAPEEELRRSGLEDSVVKILVERRKKINVEEEIEKIAKEGIEIITIDDAEYPENLKQIYNPPFVIYIRGKINKEGIRIAIVGSRKVTQYGKQAAQILAKDLASRGITIVSGLAAGIDTIAHTETLRAGQQTIAVLGSGIDGPSIYPPMNRDLAEKIANQGAVISELPIGAPPLKHHFPLRNRIISGLSLGTIIIEATETSGALITAKCALEQNREVFAVPGSIFSESSKGTNNLIKSGARLITSAQEVLDELNLASASNFIKNREILPESQEEKIILENLSHEAIHIDKISETTKLDIATLTAILTMMEMKGKVRNMGGMMYVIG